MIIWLNGTFGVGKSSTAERLAALVPGSRVLDPETVGQLLRANLGDLPVSDFQDWAAWRPLVAATLTEIARMTGQHVIAPQTVLRREYLDQIFTPLRAAELDVFHVVLDASDAVLRSRIEGSDEAREWRLAHLDEYEAARPWMVETADLVVDTAASTPPQIARRIFTALPDMPDLPATPVVAPKPRMPEKPKAAEQPKATEQPKAADKPQAGKPQAAEKPQATDKPVLEEQAKAGVAGKIAEQPGLADHR